jgi:Arc/MetJ-type ribon-helix-helix transcriptional regulator
VISSRLAPNAPALVSGPHSAFMAREPESTRGIEPSTPVHRRAGAEGSAFYGRNRWYDRRVKKSPASETTRVTISLPTSLVRELDERLMKGEPSRGAAIRRLIETALHDLEAREKRKLEEREQYIRAWREQPQTEEEFGWADRAVAEAMAEESWE